MNIRKEIIRIARENPETRRHLVPLLRKEAIEFGTNKELQRYLRQHPNADKTKHTVTKSEAPKGEDPPKDSGGSFQDFVSKVKGAKQSIVDAVKKAPQEVQQIFTDSEHRKQFLGDVASNVKKSPKAVAMRIIKSAKSEVHEIKHAVGAAKKLFKKPPGPFSKEDKKALYSAGAYVAGAMLAAVPPGTMIAAASALSHSFAMHIGIKAVSKLMDDGFLHFEWAETLFHALHVVASEKDEQGEMTEGLVRVIADVLGNLTDEDMVKILSGVDMPDED
jgi:hypothetical protein